MRLERVTARSIFSSSMSSQRAAATTGMVAVMPWLPLPELIITGSTQPFMRASLPAAGSARAMVRASLP